MNIRIGQGIDFHQLKEGLDLWLGGVKIPSNKGCVAHSDGDVLIHAVCDALLGAAGQKDIGFFFPDSNNEFRNIDSKILLKRSYEIVKGLGFRIINMDSTICLEKPKIAPFIDEMRKVIASILETETENVSIKATTTEKLGFAGKEEGLFAIAVVLLDKKIH